MDMDLTSASSPSMLKSSRSKALKLLVWISRASAIQKVLEDLLKTAASSMKKDLIS